MKLDLRIKSDKKRNMEYWDNMEEECREILNTILSNYANADTSQINEDARIDIRNLFWKLSSKNVESMESIQMLLFHMLMKIIKKEKNYEDDK